MLAGNEVVSMSSGKKSEVNLLSTFSMFCGNVMVGLVEIVIGVILDLKHDPSGEKKLFVIQICLGVISVITLFWRSRLVKKRLTQQVTKYAKV
jgi:Na+/melibiose symporter-like transporter